MRRMYAFRHRLGSAAFAALASSRRWLQRRPQASVETIVVAAASFWLLTANGPFLAAALKGRAPSDASTWTFAVALCAIVLAAHVLILGLVCNRWTVKPLLGVLAVGTAAAAYWMGSFGVYLDPSMLRNVLRTDVAEAGELLSPGLALHLALYAGVPLLLLARVQVVRRPIGRALVRRLSLLLAALAVALAALTAVFQPLSSLTRNHREVRYLVTPANYLWSAAAVLASDAHAAQAPRRTIGADAAPGPSWAARKRPLVVVLVVGETARAANWGLSGYARQTTPRLAALPVVNFPRVDACGTNTEVSLPCMFAPVGRRDYDAERIRGQESLLHVAARAGAAVHWRDNQSGCKGVCDGLPSETAGGAPCRDGRCLDEALVSDLDQRLDRLDRPGAATGGASTQLWVLHLLGNHGPSYFRRHPPGFARFQPECVDDELRSCTQEQIVNAYDNALLYTDHVLATAIERLAAHAGRVDSALLFVSDHGESLGEKGLFLHGVPHAIAPQEQTRVPMVFWASDGFEAASGLPAGCLMPALQRQAARPQAHDALFHTLLGLLDIHTALHEPRLDLTSACRAPH